MCISLERADRIRRRAGVEPGVAPDGSEFSENSNTSSTLNDENIHPFDTSDIHQKGKEIDCLKISNSNVLFSINVVKNK